MLLLTVEAVPLALPIKLPSPLNTSGRVRAPGCRSKNCAVVPVL
jgi:hypothetical protein